MEVVAALLGVAMSRFWRRGGPTEPGPRIEPEGREVFKPLQPGSKTLWERQTGHIDEPVTTTPTAKWNIASYGPGVQVLGEPDVPADLWPPHFQPEETPMTEPVPPTRPLNATGPARPVLPDDLTHLMLTYGASVVVEAIEVLRAAAR